MLGWTQYLWCGSTIVCRWNILLLASSRVISGQEVRSKPEILINTITSISNLCCTWYLLFRFKSVSTRNLFCFFGTYMKCRMQSPKSLSKIRNHLMCDFFLNPRWPFCQLWTKRWLWVSRIWPSRRIDYNE